MFLFNYWSSLFYNNYSNIKWPKLLNLRISSLLGFEFFKRANHVESEIFTQNFSSNGFKESVASISEHSVWCLSNLGNRCWFNSIILGRECSTEEVFFSVQCSVWLCCCRGVLILARRFLLCLLVRLTRLVLILWAI